MLQFLENLKHIIAQISNITHTIWNYKKAILKNYMDNSGAFDILFINSKHIQGNLENIL